MSLIQSRTRRMDSKSLTTFKKGLFTRRGKQANPTCESVDTKSLDMPSHFAGGPQKAFLCVPVNLLNSFGRFLIPEHNKDLICFCDGKYKVCHQQCKHQETGFRLILKQKFYFLAFHRKYVVY